MQVIVDLDGTLSLNKHREHFIKQDPPDWDAFFEACDQDEPNMPVILTVMALNKAGHEIIIFSGRSDQVREKTEHWLERFRVPHSRLIMRQEGDYTPDHRLKETWLESEPGIAPDFTIDDRQKVVDMWRRNGIPCWQVAPGDF